jgi:hypothetical protein
MLGLGDEGGVGGGGRDDGGAGGDSAAAEVGDRAEAKGWWRKDAGMMSDVMVKE